MNDHKPTCEGPYGEQDCPDDARFAVVRYRLPSRYVCPVHLGPSLLLTDGVLWPPQISMIGRGHAGEIR
ncbi:hypothetical protein PV682_31900 [Streptomyces niveiscabiei]|uniref:hypothetical protein n=1 Tax=Streptomyces niveiscabiei TaxID=164115 RepID=UPI0029B24D9E|nr:hypothetical protein [Streptomyces niveiscabiei]MDX3386027.1 hypothetical protein [Streptomyces niveiscabiei]